MNVTGNMDNCRKLQEEGHVQIVSAEQRGYVQVHTNGRITENNSTNASNQTDNLLEKILHWDNMNKAFKDVTTQNSPFSHILSMCVNSSKAYLS